MNRMRLLSSALVVLLIAGCDFQKDDTDAVLFNGTWRLVEAGSRQTDFTALVLARYDEVVVTFIEDERDFTMILNVSDTPDDEILNGTFSVDSDDREIDLSFSNIAASFDFDYQFVTSGKVVLSSDDDEPILETLFGIELEVDDVFLVFEQP